MDTYLVTPENVVVGFHEGERVEVLQAVSSCLRGCGLSPWPELEAELYRGRGETLLLARPAPPVCARGCAAPVRRKRQTGI